jgi:hypothetical protein
MELVCHEEQESQRRWYQLSPERDRKKKAEAGLPHLLAVRSVLFFPPHSVYLIFISTSLISLLLILSTIEPSQLSFVAAPRNPLLVFLLSSNLRKQLS